MTATDLMHQLRGNKRPLRAVLRERQRARAREDPTGEMLVELGQRMATMDWYDLTRLQTFVNAEVDRRCGPICIAGAARPTGSAGSKPPRSSTRSSTRLSTRT
jgi:hypothetical protein